MPVVYVAVGRRLGLPVHLVEARGHLLFRWDDPHGTTIDWDGPNVRLWIPPDRFNVEGSGEGIAFYPDAHYIQWPEMWTEQDFEHGRYLRTMSATEDLAAFLVQRAECFYEAGDWNGCLKSIAMAPIWCRKTCGTNGCMPGGRSNGRITKTASPGLSKRTAGEDNNGSPSRDCRTMRPTAAASIANGCAKKWHRSRPHRTARVANACTASRRVKPARKR